MRFYAERPLRLARQLLADVLVVAWVVLCIAVARESYETTLRLQAPGQEMAQAGVQMQMAFDDAADTAGRIPLIGEDLARALGAGSQAGASLTATGQEQIARPGVRGQGDRGLGGAGRGGTGAAAVAVAAALLRPRRPVRGDHPTRRHRPAGTAGADPPAGAPADRRGPGPGNRLAAGRPRGHPPAGRAGAAVTGVVGAVAATGLSAPVDRLAR